MQLKIIRGSTSFSIPTDKVRWTTKLDGAAILEFSSPWRTLIAAVGDRLLALSEDQAFFDGFVFQAADNGRQQTVLCYDRLKYLLYRDTKVFHNRTAAQIVTEILKERELPAGTIQNTGYVIPLLAEEGKPLLSMIRSALDETTAASGREFVFYDDAGQLSLRVAAENPAGVLLCGENQLISYQQTEDIDGDTFNRFKIWQEDGRSGFRRVTVADVPDAQQKWGVLQYFERIDSSLNPSQVAERIRALREAKCRARISLDTECLSDLACRAGKTVLVRLAEGDQVQTCLIEEAQHSFSGNVGRMQLKLRRLL